jgi:hypothetical protein
LVDNLGLVVTPHRKTALLGLTQGLGSEGWRPIPRLRRSVLLGTFRKAPARFRICTKIGDASNLCILGQVLAAVWVRTEQGTRAPNFGFRVQTRTEQRTRAPNFGFRVQARTEQRTRAPNLHAFSFRTMPTRRPAAHTQVHTQKPTHTHARTHARHTHTHTHAHAHAHAQLHANNRTHTHTRAHACTHTSCENLCRLANGGHQTIRERRRFKTPPFQLCCGKG